MATASRVTVRGGFSGMTACGGMAACGEMASDERRQGCSIRASSRHHAVEKFSRLVEEEMKTEAQDLRSCATDAHGCEIAELPPDHSEAWYPMGAYVPAFL